MVKVDLSLILACYNEGSTLPKSLNRIINILDDTNYKWEIICIDDCSNDKTAKILERFAKEQLNITFISHKVNIGRGGSVKEGIIKARGEVAGFIDVDLEVSPVYILEFVKAIRNGADVAIATRIYKESTATFIRWIASKFYSQIVRSLLKIRFKDTEAGYKFFNRLRIIPVLEYIKNPRWFFDTEIVAKSLCSKLKIVEIPVLFLRRTDKKSTVRLLRDSVDYLVAIWKLKIEK